MSNSFTAIVDYGVGNLKKCDQCHDIPGDEDMYHQ